MCMLFYTQSRYESNLKEEDPIDESLESYALVIDGNFVSRVDDFQTDLIICNTTKLQLEDLKCRDNFALNDLQFKWVTIF